MMFFLMPIDLMILLLTLLVGLITSAILSSLAPMVSIPFACIFVGIWRFKTDRKTREVQERNNHHQKIYYASGAVYVAESRASGWMKVGYTAEAVEKRQKTLNDHAIGGMSDWRIVIFQPHFRAGRLEVAVRRRLKALKVTRVPEQKYKSTGHGSREIFMLDLQAASAAVRRESKKQYLAFILEVPFLVIGFPLLVVVFARSLGLG
jgi:hypothetical protein